MRLIAYQKRSIDMRVLAIMCHPDDMEYVCGGTLLKYKKEGHEVFLCTIANGNMGHMVILPDELREIRTKEAQKSSAIAGFNLMQLDFGDLTISSSNEEQLNQVTKAIRDTKPDVIITHYPGDYCSDHNELSRIVFKASFDASCPHFKPELGDATDMTPLYYVDTDLSINFVPTEYVDITDVMETKIEMLKCHESQLKWISDHDGIDFTEQMRVMSMSRGAQCGVKYAEGFTQAIVSQRMRTYRVLP